MKRCINLGITDQRCDQYEIINLVRNIKPSLISLTTSTRALDHESLNILADTILYAERNYIHRFRKDLTEDDNKWCDDLLGEFASQLGLESEEDIKDFKVAGLAVMLADDLYPHIDAMNPKGKDDLTVQFNFPIDIEMLDEECQTLVRLAFGENTTELPVTLILYPRRCLLNYGKRLKDINDFPNLSQKEKKGRKALISVLSDVGSTLDFNSRCFTSGGYSRRVSEITSDDGLREYISSKAAVDKMVRYRLLSGEDLLVASFNTHQCFSKFVY